MEYFEKKRRDISMSPLKLRNSALRRAIDFPDQGATGREKVVVGIGPVAKTATSSTRWAFWTFYQGKTQFQARKEVFSWASGNIGMGGEVERIVLFLILSAPALGVQTLDSTCTKVNSAHSTQKVILTFAKALPVDRERPFVDGYAADLARILGYRFSEYRGLPSHAAQLKLREEALALAANPYAISVNSEGAGYQYRFDVQSGNLEIITKEGKIVFFWKLEPGNFFHGFKDHIDFFVKAAAEGNLRPGFGIPRDQLGEFSTGSLKVHHDRHGREDVKWRTPEGYQEDALKFAQSDDSTFLIIRKKDNNGEHLIKYDPVSNRFLVMKWLPRQSEWTFITFYKPDPARTPHASNIEHFLSQLDPSKNFN